MNHEEMISDLKNELKALKDEVKRLSGLLISQKKVLTVQEVADYAGLSKTFVYRMTSTGVIPFYKPRGKMIYFNKEEVETWLLHNQEREEIGMKSATYVTLNHAGGVK